MHDERRRVTKSIRTKGRKSLDNGTVTEGDRVVSKTYGNVAMRTMGVHPRFFSDWPSRREAYS